MTDTTQRQFNDIEQGLAFNRFEEIGDRMVGHRASAFFFGIVAGEDHNWNAGRREPELNLKSINNRHV